MTGVWSKRRTQSKTEIQGQMVQKFPWKAPRKSVTNLMHVHTNHSTNNFGTSVGKINIKLIFKICPLL